MLIRSLKSLHRYWYLFSVLLFFLIFYPFLYYYSRKRKRFGKLNRIRRIMGFLSSGMAGIFYRYKFEQKLDPDQHYIFCPNHSSNLDITALSLMVHGNFAFLGKEDLLDNPVTALFFKTVDIPVNRESKIASFRAFKRAGEYLQREMSLVIFPEGMIADVYPPRLHQFKNGPFRLAIEHQVAIVPVSIRNAWQLMWDDGKKYGSSPGLIEVIVHKPVQTRELEVEAADVLKDRVYQTLKNSLDED